MKRVTLLFCIALMMIVGCKTESKIRVIKLAHVLDTTHPVHKGMVFMAEKVLEKSGGKSGQPRTETP